MAFLKTVKWTRNKYRTKVHFMGDRQLTYTTCARKIPRTGRHSNVKIVVGLGDSTDLHEELYCGQCLRRFYSRGTTDIEVWKEGVSERH